MRKKITFVAALLALLAGLCACAGNVRDIDLEKEEIDDEAESRRLERKLEETDSANIRAAYAEIMAMALTEEYPTADKTVGKITYKKAAESAGVHFLEATVTASQTRPGWQNKNFADWVLIGDNTVDASTVGWTLTYTEGGENVVITVLEK